MLLLRDFSNQCDDRRWEDTAVHGGATLQPQCMIDLLNSMGEKVSNKEHSINSNLVNMKVSLRILSGLADAKFVRSTL